MKYSISIDHELKIIRYKHSGNLLAEDIGYVWENEFLKMKEFTQMDYYLLSDYTEATFNIPTSFLPELMAFMESIKSVVKGKKQSIVIADPYSTAASLIFENEVNNAVGFFVKVFCTYQAALAWLIR